MQFSIFLVCFRCVAPRRGERRWEDILSIWFSNPFSAGDTLLRLYVDSSSVKILASRSIFLSRLDKGIIYHESEKYRSPSVTRLSYRESFTRSSDGSASDYRVFQSGNNPSTDARGYFLRDSYFSSHVQVTRSSVNWLEWLNTLIIKWYFSAFHLINQLYQLFDAINLSACPYSY